ncbi:gamma-glutamylaminecyclotransferase isoform X2 [Aplysia californica]|uniref:Gamma-glutamylcyclotransferase family protein n=1 Tax=Aplysia californica TaxID=6500 RepID=A0ABM1W404_APLCA|nr:gamma-glutamylaminecyclotransferase isoform X2 [Aplysia californica]
MGAWLISQFFKVNIFWANIKTRVVTVRTGIMSHKHFLFSYGTLKEGQPNAAVMHDPGNGKATFIGTGHTTKKYPLIIGSQYGMPYLLLAEGEGKNVKGEVFEIDEQMLEFLDKFEVHPTLYRRQLAAVNVTHGASKEELSELYTLDCWVYFQHEYTPEMLSLPHVEDYNSCSEESVSSYPQIKRAPCLEAISYSHMEH